MLNLLEYPKYVLDETIIVAENLKTEEYFIMTGLQAKQMNYHYVGNYETRNDKQFFKNIDKRNQLCKKYSKQIQDRHNKPKRYYKPVDVKLIDKKIPIQDAKILLQIIAEAVIKTIDKIGE